MAKLPLNFVTAANDRYNQAKDFLSNWKIAARDDFGFIAGDQWNSADENKLESEDKPVVTFNYSAKMIDAVIGAEVSNRQEATYRPRELTDAAQAEIRNNAAKWVRDQCNAEDEESDAFRDALICGIGCTQTRMSYDDDLDGNVEIHRIDPLEILYDPSSTKPCLADRRYNFRIWWISKTDARNEWPDQYAFASEDLDGNAGVTRTGHSYEDDADTSYDMHKDQVQIRHYECFEREAVYRIETPQGMQELSQSEFSSVKQALTEAGTKYVKQFRKVYYHAFFAGETLLEGDLSPCQKGFTFNFITGKRDRNRNYWDGLTRVMKDPQRWANKWLSQILYIINSNAKGGLLAETGAFVDPKKAQDEWSSPDSITLLNEGGINKIKEKVMTTYPSGLDKLMQFALGSLPMVTGINLEALGLANREQAGVLEQQRKQAAYGLLAPLFDSLRRHRKIQSRVLMSFINDFISDGRLVRMGGQESQQFVPLIKLKDGMEYDISVDDSPTAPDVKEKTWQTLTQILPAMMKAGLPIPPDLLDFTPLPVALATKWKAFVAQQQKQQGPSPEQLKQMQEQMRKLSQENQQLKMEMQNKQVDQQQNQEKLQAEIEMKRAALMEDLKLAREKQDAELSLQRDKVTGELGIKGTAIEYKQKVDQYKANSDHITSIIEAIAKLANEKD